MDANDIAKAIELGKSLGDLKKIKGNIQEAKQEQARINKNIVILKRANLEEQQKYDESNQEREKRKDELETNMKALEAKRANLATSAVPEVKKLEALREELAKTRANIAREQNDIATRTDLLNKKENTLEDKKDILTQIAKLAEKL
jgi:chromosome segregation ATPase